MMRDDELELLVIERAKALVAPFKDVTERALALLERLTDRVEVLELEVLHRREARIPFGNSESQP
jgi:hypothetical protein